jgi:threonine synthase
MHVVKFDLRCVSCGEHTEKVDKYGNCKECQDYFHEQWKCTGLNPNNQEIYPIKKQG